MRWLLIGVLTVNMPLTVHIVWRHHRGESARWVLAGYAIVLYTAVTFAAWRILP